MKKVIFVIFILTGIPVHAQVPLIIEGQTYTNSSNHWWGVTVEHTVPTALIFRNNSITTVNESGYMFQSGEDAPSELNNNLDGAVITGNKLTWNGTEPASMTHGMINGYHINYVVKYNYMDKVPYAMVIKSGQNGDNMTYTAGGYAYNIFRNSKNSIILKGMNGVSIFNNTFYNDIWNPIVIVGNTDNNSGAPCLNIKIKNNIFYSKKKTEPIFIYYSESLASLECDYNVYYCEEGDHTPTFTVRSTKYTWAQWRALGFDTHSIVVNPNFIDTISLVPSTRLDYGTDLGPEWKDGLSVNAVWGTTNPATTQQGVIWQAGARIYDNTGSNLTYINSVVSNADHSVIDITFNLTLANIIPDASAFTVMINSVVGSIKKVVIVGNHVQLTLESPVSNGNQVTVAYSKPGNNPLQTPDKKECDSFTDQPVINDITVSISNIKNLTAQIYPNPASDYLSFRLDESLQKFKDVKMNIIDLSGAILLNKYIDSSLREFGIPINLKDGLYFIQLVHQQTILLTQKLIVSHHK